MINHKSCQSHDFLYFKGSQGRGVEAASTRQEGVQTDQGAADPRMGRVDRGALLQGGGPLCVTQVTICCQYVNERCILIVNYCCRFIGLISHLVVGSRSL